MSRGKYITGHLAVAVLVAAMTLPILCSAQKVAPHPAPSPPGPPPQQHVSQPPATLAQPQSHVGDWLRQYKDLPPDEQERELQKDPAFRQLPQAKQQRYLRRLQNFSTLPPERQIQILNRMDTWAHLTPEQKREVQQCGSFRPIAGP